MRKLLIALALIMGGTLWANPVDTNMAKQIAQTFIAQKKHSKVELKNVSQLAGFTNLYFFNSKNEFVIVAADDRVQPILGYSENNLFDASNMPPNLREWLMGYEQQIQFAKNENIEPSEEVITVWNTLLHGDEIAPKSTKSVSALLTTTWDQSPYYNNLCPSNPYTNERTVTGCAATAMAQVMKYWNHPSHGSGFHSYNSNFGTLSANFATTTYDWNNMPNRLTLLSSSTQKTAVATLMYHCGVSVDMSYGFASSGTIPSLIAPALISFFNYDASTHLVQKNNYTNNGWTSLLINELDAGRPIIYCGYGEGGHCFVCDGYNNNDYFHFNWGWGGSCDGYYSVLDLTPGTGGTGAGNGSYTNDQIAIIGVQPSNAATSNLCMYTSLSFDNSHFWFGSNMTGTIQVLNEGNTPYTGQIAVALFNSEGIYIDAQYFNVNALHHNYYATGNINISGGVPFIPGQYYAIALYNVDGDSWDVVPAGSSASYATSFSVYYSAQMETYSAFSTTTFTQGETAAVNVDVTNSGSNIFYGKVRVNLASIEDGSIVQTIQELTISNGLQSNYHYTNGLDFTGTITAQPGTYLLELAYQRSGETTWYYAGSSYYQNPVFATIVAPPTLSVSPTSLSFQQSGGSEPVEVTSNVIWSATSSASWLTISPNSGTESDILIVTASANNTNSARTATITFTGNNGVSPRIITVSQEGPSQYTISVYSADPNMGSVSGSGTYMSGSTATIGAIPNNGYRFTKWQDNNTQNPRTITVNSNATYTAYFEPILSIEDETLDDSRIYACGDQIIIECPTIDNVAIYDIMGRLVEVTNKHYIGKAIFHVSNPGIYFVKTNGYLSQKVIILY